MAPEFENYSSTSHVLKSWLLFLNQLFYYVQHLHSLLTLPSALHTAASLLEVAKSSIILVQPTVDPVLDVTTLQQMLPCR